MYFQFAPGQASPPIADTDVLFFKVNSLWCLGSTKGSPRDRTAQNQLDLPHFCELKEQPVWLIKGDLRIQRSPVLSQMGQAKPGELATLNASFVRNHVALYSIFRKWVHWRWVKDKALQWDLTCFLYLCVCGSCGRRDQWRRCSLRLYYLNTVFADSQKCFSWPRWSSVLRWGVVRTVRTTFSCFSKLLCSREAVTAKTPQGGAAPQKNAPQCWAAHVPEAFAWSPFQGLIFKNLFYTLRCKGNSFKHL